MISRKKLKLSENTLALGAIVFFIGFLFDIIPMWLGGAAVIIGGLAINVIFSRCPNCGKYIRDLSSNQTDPARCKHCGETAEIND